MTHWSQVTSSGNTFESGDTSSSQTWDGSDSTTNQFFVVSITTSIVTSIETSITTTVSGDTVNALSQDTIGLVYREMWNDISAASDVTGSRWTLGAGSWDVSQRSNNTEIAGGGGAEPIDYIFSDFGAVPNDFVAQSNIEIRELGASSDQFWVGVSNPSLSIQGDEAYYMIIRAAPQDDIFITKRVGGTNEFVATDVLGEGIGLAEIWSIRLSGESSDGTYDLEMFADQVSFMTELEVNLTTRLTHSDATPPALGNHAEIAALSDTIFDEQWLCGSVITVRGLLNNFSVKISSLDTLTSTGGSDVTHSVRTLAMPFSAITVFDSNDSALTFHHFDILSERTSIFGGDTWTFAQTLPSESTSETTSLTTSEVTSEGFLLLSGSTQTWSGSTTSDYFFHGMKAFQDGSGGIDFIHAVASPAKGGPYWRVATDRNIMLRSRSNITSAQSIVEGVP